MSPSTAPFVSFHYSSVSTNFSICFENPSPKRKREGGREQLAPQPWGLLAELSPQSQIDSCRNWLREMVSRGEARGVEQASAALVGLEGKEEAMKFMGALLESMGVT